MAQSNLPMFYRNPVPLNSEQHSALTISQRPEGFRFAASSRTVLLAASELYDAARQFPIIFTQTADNGILPVALLGLEENENLFVDETGGWNAAYIPAYIRRYPFITTDGTEGRTTVCIDEDFEGFNLEGGLPLFENGEPTEKTKEIQAFLQDYLFQMQQTREFGALLLQDGLLREINVQAALNDGHSYLLNGMLVVDEEKLSQLPDTDIAKLFRTGSLALIHAHLISLRSLNALVERKAKVLAGAE